MRSCQRIIKESSNDTLPDCIVDKLLNFSEREWATSSPKRPNECDGNGKEARKEQRASWPDVRERY